MRFIALHGCAGSGNPLGVSNKCNEILFAFFFYLYSIKKQTFFNELQSKYQTSLFHRFL